MSKERERHELGYFLDAPLPTMLSHDDVYGDYHFTEVDDSLMGGYDNTLSTLANYLNNALLYDIIVHVLNNYIRYSNFHSDMKNHKTHVVM